MSAEGARAPSHLLETKLSQPPVRGSHVARPRLAALVGEGLRGKLTLVSAPPGFGKSALLAESLDAARAAGLLVAWVSLDAEDSDPATFWTYTLSALGRVSPSPALETALSLLDG